MEFCFLGVKRCIDHSEWFSLIYFWILKQYISIITENVIWLPYFSISFYHIWEITYLTLNYINFTILSDTPESTKFFCLSCIPYLSFYLFFNKQNLKSENATTVHDSCQCQYLSVYRWKKPKPLILICFGYRDMIWGQPPFWQG